ncbi:MAG TPA: AGE family epimerase/isomerase [Vicinamibacterales bacterium]|nr:AGE family epimerase/isomerase [Vicinamibacterales bacterium]
MTKERIRAARDELRRHLTEELLPFWLARCKDDVNGGFVTHFDQHGKDTGEDEKSLIAQSRCVYTFAAAHRAGYGGGECAEFARHGVDFLLDRMWDRAHGGFCWTVDRRGRVQIDKKILYGLSFAIYSLSEYTLATGDPRGIEYAQRTFDLVERHCADPALGGYFEMFERDWTRCGPGAGGGDRKTLDVHMHLMEAFTTLFECSRRAEHRRALQENIDLLVGRFLHPQYATGIPQFWADWRVAPQIKFDIVWGWDRFAEGGAKPHADDNTSYGHNVECAWLLLHALDVMGADRRPYEPVVRKQLDHAVRAGVDFEYGGVYVEGPHDGGPAYDTEKEFWQQAETMIGMLDGCRLFGMEPYWQAYEAVHRFVMDRMVNREVGEWWPLLSRDGRTRIWTHMSHSWKINYHSVRGAIQSIARLEELLAC